MLLDNVRGHVYRANLHCAVFRTVQASIVRMRVCIVSPRINAKLAAKTCIARPYTVSYSLTVGAGKGRRSQRRRGEGRRGVSSDRYTYFVPNVRYANSPAGRFHILPRLPFCSGRGKPWEAGN